MQLSGWGRYPAAEVHLAHARSAAEVSAAVAGAGHVIARGNGRAYGDAALCPELTLEMGRMDRLLSFDQETGWLTCQAGVLIADILRVFVPRGFFPMVVPGTKFVSVGGAIAADIHGKNHHGAGSFCDHVNEISLLTASGEVVRCSAAENPTLFAATRGGMGLTGVILSATIKLQKIETAYIRQATVKAGSLDDVMAGFEASGEAPYSVAWIDCLARGKSLGRSLLYLGAHARVNELDPDARLKPLSIPARDPFGGAARVPFDVPALALNRFSMGLFNEIYYRRGKPGMKVIDYDRAFFPLDSVRDWNRLYGRRGLVQYQCVVPKAEAERNVARILEETSRAGLGSFLAVLKLLGSEGDGMLSFPMPGYTLALDFPVSPSTFALVKGLDRIVADCGGRIYLAKDALSDAALMAPAYPRLAEFRQQRAESGADRKFTSLMAQRLLL
ncbi:MAG TPA: FAD-binding oxidoreductase [Rhizomicrobium sp.]|nr:FAD-binding oxidoreductase [Rhizomicrobium sp.]